MTPNIRAMKRSQAHSKVAWSHEEESVPCQIWAFELALGVKYEVEAYHTVQHFAFQVVHKLKIGPDAFLLQGRNN